MVDITTYTDSHGDAYQAIQIPWQQVTAMLGHQHDGGVEDDDKLVELLLQDGAPTWVANMDIWKKDEKGWLVKGPRA